DRFPRSRRAVSARPRPRFGRGVALRVGLAAWVLTLVVLVLFPVYLVFMVSLAPGPALFGERPALVVTAPTSAFWRRVVARGELLGPLLKSLTVATGATALALALAAPGATPSRAGPSAGDTSCSSRSSSRACCPSSPSACRSPRASRAWDSSTPISG